MKISQKGLDLIKEFEGCSLTAYRCPSNIPTIGYGSTGPHVCMGMHISQEEADRLLLNDVERFEELVTDLCTVEPTQDQFDAMVALAFNIGPGSTKHHVEGFITSSVLRLHNQGWHDEAAQAFQLWNKGGGRVLNGLVRRRAAESNLYQGKA